MRTSVHLGRIAIAWGLFLHAFLAGSLAPGLMAQKARDDEDPTKEAEPDERDPDEEQTPPTSKPTEREKSVLALFNATSGGFKDGRIVLVYYFQGKNEALVDDWSPSLDQTKQRVRWSGPGEGRSMVKTATGASYREGGIIVGDNGQWLHKAGFLSDVEVTVDHMSVAQPRAGAFVAPVFQNAKKKLSLGVANGYQAVCLRESKQSKPPHPKDDKPTPQRVRRTIGYRYNGKVLESYLNGKKTSDTAAVPRFTEGFDSGRVGIAWNSIQCFVFKVTITGRLDPDWVAEALGETGSKAKGGKKGSS